MAHAEALLAELGYRPDPYSTRQEVEHDSPWRKPDGTMIDLHRGFTHIPAALEVTWSALSKQSRQLEVAGEVIDAPSESASALLVALHALGDAPSKGKAFEDLTRAIQRVPPEKWEETRALAHDLRAERNLAAALAMTAEGARIAELVRLPKLGRREIYLRTGPRHAMAALIDRTFRSGGFRNAGPNLVHELTRTRPVTGSDPVGEDAGRSPLIWQARRLGRGLARVPVAFASWVVQRKDFRG